MTHKGRKELRKKLQELAQGIKLTQESENALLRHLQYTLDANRTFPPEFTEDKLALLEDLQVCLNHRKVVRKRVKRLEYIENREMLIPEAEALAYIKLKEEASPEPTEDDNDRFNKYFHTAMSKLAFERLGVTDSNTI